MKEGKQPALFNLSQLDHEDFELIDALTPKQLESLVHGVDLIRARLKGKTPVIVEKESVENAGKNTDSAEELVKDLRQEQDVVLDADNPKNAAKDQGTGIIVGTDNASLSTSSGVIPEVEVQNVEHDEEGFLVLLSEFIKWDCCSLEYDR
ncbi:hypothetical protein RIF29_01896 [Crotalaria pallida]|uniref:Uncharacterized protein n=1 Tax=Crotalaria pallida TaxID=3830 RepID=A0AAN9P8A6_CROPI